MTVVNSVLYCYTGRNEFKKTKAMYLVQSFVSDNSTVCNVLSRLHNNVRSVYNAPAFLRQITANHVQRELVSLGECYAGLENWFEKNYLACIAVKL